MWQQARNNNSNTILQTYVAAPVKNCFHRCQPLVLFALESLKLVLDTLAGIPGTTGTLENPLGSCKSGFSFFLYCSVPSYKKKFCVCLYLWGWAIYIVKLLVLMRSEGNRNYSGRREKNKKQIKGKLYLHENQMVIESLKKKCFEFGAFQFMLLFFCKFAVNHSGLIYCKIE